MSLECMAWAVKQTAGSTLKKAVLMNMANSTNHQTGICRPRMKLMAEEIESTVPAIQKAISEMAAQGLLEEVKRMRDDEPAPSDYRLLMAGRAAPAGQPAAPEKKADIPEGTKKFIDLWNTAAGKSGLAKINEWTPKRGARLKALANIYGKGMAKSMELAVEECHKSEWCVKQKVGVDHILIQDNFQRYLDKARAVEGTSPPAPAEEAKGGLPEWVEVKIGLLQKEKRKYEQEGRTQSAADVQREIDKLRRGP